MNESSKRMLYTWTLEGGNRADCQRWPGRWCLTDMNCITCKCMKDQEKDRFQKINQEPALWHSELSYCQQHQHLIQKCWFESRRLCFQASSINTPGKQKQMAQTLVSMPTQVGDLDGAQDSWLRAARGPIIMTMCRSESQVEDLSLFLVHSSSLSFPLYYSAFQIYFF